MFCKLRTVPHYGLCCVYNGGSGVFRAGAKILALVQGTERSTVQDVGMGKVICTKVVDPADTQFTTTVRTYASEMRLLDYKLDRNFGVVCVTAHGEHGCEIDWVKVLPKEDRPLVMAAWELLDIK